jgi:transposase
MLTQEDYSMIQELHNKGLYKHDIADRLGVHPKTVGRALKRGGAPSPTRRRSRFVKLEPYMTRVDELFAEGVRNARVIYREIQELGYTGGITVLRVYLHPKRQQRLTRATVRFETEPGVQLQHDWGEIVVPIAGVTTKVYIAVNTLGYSRRFHVFAAPRCDAEHTYESIVRAFEWFGGAVREVWVDNQKSAVLKHVPGSVRFNPRFWQLARHYGFRPKACRPYRARTKGKVERMVGYVKHHFFQRYRSFESLDHLNVLLRTWLIAEADPRLHGTVREVVTTRFERERPALQPLPICRFDTRYVETRRVGWDAYVEVRGNRYSVPSACCGEPVTCLIGLDGTLTVWHEQREIARHHLTPPEKGWQTVPEHHRRLWAEVSVQARPLSIYEEVTHATR